MKLDAKIFGLSTMIVVALSWVVCSLLVVALPGLAMRVTDSMLHADLPIAGWSLSWSGFFIGLVAWSVVAGIFVWAIAALYNRLLKRVSIGTSSAQ